jgi:hypothetical protein
MNPAVDTGRRANTLPAGCANQALLAPSQASAIEPAPAFDGTQGIGAWPAATDGEAAVLPQGCDTGCCGEIGPFLCLGDLGEPVYAWGTLEATFPSLSIEKEFLQAIDPADAAGFDPSDTLDLWRLNEMVRSSPTLYKVLSRPGNLYIAREMCWHLIGPDGGRLWAIRPRNDKEVARLVTALEPDQNAVKQPQVLLGRRSPTPASPQCNGAPAVTFNRLYRRTATDLASELMAAYPPLAQTPAQVQPLVADLLAMAPGVGESDEARALNYLLLNVLELYYQTYQLLYTRSAPNSNGYELIAMESLPRQGSGGREQMDLVLVFQSNDTGTLSRWYYRVDVAGDFPYLVQGWRRYVQV